MDTKVIVLTPVRNEAWILHRFLKATSTYADHIIVLDQFSDDGSQAICEQYPKVTLLHAESEEYDEAERQITLINKARELEPQAKRLLLALDADEIFAADALIHPEWEQMLTAPKGTVFYFPKHDFFKSTKHYLDYQSPWPLAFMDDGSEHQPKKIHSIRIPVPEGNPKMELPNLNIMHYSKVDLRRQRAKMRMYAAIQNVNGIGSTHSRRLRYSRHSNWLDGGTVKESPDSWFAGYENQGIDMRDIETEEYFWQDRKVIELFAEHGCQQFWKEDIWEMDWQKTAQHFGYTNLNIELPGPLTRLYWDLQSWLYRLYAKLRS